MAETAPLFESFLDEVLRSDGVFEDKKNISEDKNITNRFRNVMLRLDMKPKDKGTARHRRTNL